MKNIFARFKLVFSVYLFIYDVYANTIIKKIEKKKNGW